ncbi:MAG: patatin-like phospholipase family protein [Sulfurifustis sp.]
MEPHRTEHATGSLSTPLDDIVRTDEQERIRTRRETLGVNARTPGNWGLALSGGGIRSATFALGVLQALAKAPSPDAASGSKRSQKALLERFDYLSTVSGGGYIGSFFCSLFRPGRLRESVTDPKTVAQNAYEVLRYEPPGRMRLQDRFRDEHIGKAPMAWLRDNGRYLAPTGGGDLVQLIALTIRNWFAVHYVLGTLLLCALVLVAIGRTVLAYNIEGYNQLEQTWLNDALDGVGVWWSPLWVFPALLVVLWVLPFGAAYWLTHPGRGKTDNTPPSWRSAAALADLLLAIAAFIAAYWVAQRARDWAPITTAIGGGGFIALLGFVVHGLTSWGLDSITEHRERMTRGLADGLKLLLATTIVAAADTLGQHIYLRATLDHAAHALTPAAVIGALVWLMRRTAAMFDEKEKPAWIQRLPVGIIAGGIGGIVFLTVVTLWALLVQWARWHGAIPEPTAVADTRHIEILVLLLALFLVLAVTAGHFSGFLNLSTLQHLYGSRLCRAYLGASNGKRFVDTDGESRRERHAQRAKRSAAEPLASDHLTHAEYYENALAPIHIVNVTVNQTVDPAEQLVQRDRKGRPMAVLPTGFSIDDTHYAFRHAGEFNLRRALRRAGRQIMNSDREHDGDTQILTISEWVGTSGAAFTTGLGRTTSLGVSLAFAMANLRLGRWWPSGYGQDTSRGFEWLFKSIFKTHAFLFYETVGRFHGLRREWQYLSDGGHFENTAVYELLRPERDVRLVVVCDDGCDPAYRFGDLANLIRLARIDFRCEIEVDMSIAADARLGKVFGVPGDFGSEAGADDKCAILLNVYRSGNDGRPGTPDCRIILLKPRLIRSAPLDVCEYRHAHRDFPQETTADQFFDEAQWESYRCLGHSIGTRVFGSAAQQGVGEALWHYLLGNGARPQR